MDPGKGLDLDMGQVVPIGLMADGEEDKAVLRVGDDDALLEGAPLEDGEEALHEEGPAEVLVGLTRDENMGFSLPGDGGALLHHHQNEAVLRQEGEVDHGAAELLDGERLRERSAWSCVSSVSKRLKDLWNGRAIRRPSR